MSGSENTVWNDAARAASLFAVDPAGIGGVSLRAPTGLLRDRWLDRLRDALQPPTTMRKIPLGIGDGRLLGGLDLAATLRTGTMVAAKGVLAENDGGVVLLAMAERLPAATAARLVAAIDTGEIVLARDGIEQRNPARVGVVALDEGMAEDERPPAALLDRLAFWIDFSDLPPRDAGVDHAPAEAIEAARKILLRVRANDEVVEALCGTAMALGIASIRAPILALNVSRAAAAMAGREEIALEDAALACRLVLAPRAKILPPGEPAAEQSQADDGPPDSPRDTEGDAGDDNAPPDGTPGEILLEAARAAIPAGLLAQLKSLAGQRVRTPTAGRVGAPQNAGLRGRPAGVRAGEPRGGLRLNVIETLRAAAPWQRLRRAEAGSGGAGRVVVQREDFRVNRLKQRAETTTIFVVDASGSSALNRLAEAKGAIELLLAECYVRRDRVAVVAFRGKSAELLLPPTRSLVRAKRGLAGLPGGGGTPLAAGIAAGMELADATRRRGGTPAVVLLTDGRANVSRDGTGGRARAEQEALAAARALRAARFGCLLIDVSPRKSEAAERLAVEMGARYLPLPYANAALLSVAVRAATTRP